MTPETGEFTVLHVAVGSPRLVAVESHTAD
jgi:hypothetical protein